jgi:hypothetical protein
MGGATFLIGLIPTYRQIGIWAPILLVLLCIAQGVATGGRIEWRCLDDERERTTRASRVLLGVEPVPATKVGGVAEVTR